MPAARSLVRNKSGFLGVGMGVLQTGETVLLVRQRRAPIRWSSRRSSRRSASAASRAEVKYTFELLGMTREQVDRQEQNLRKGRRIADAGIYQASQWITGQFPDPTVPKKWLKERRPDVYAELFPAESGAGPCPVRTPISHSASRKK